jgi:hypothetical protein
MINITFTHLKGTGRVHIEAWLCGARVADAVRELPDYAPADYFDTPEVRATMTDIAQPVIDRLREHFAQPEPAEDDAGFLKRFKDNYQDIIESCPMWNEAKPISELK